jgi:hypothetical protein
MPEEGPDVEPGEIPGLAAQVQGHPPVAGRHRHPAADREPVVPIAMEQARRLPAGRPRGQTLGMSRNPLSSTNTRWAPRRATFFYPGPFRVLPAGNGSLISFDRAPLGFLAAPAQGRQHLPDVARVVANAELLVDQVGHPRHGPEIGRVARPERPPHEQPDELVLLARGQPRRSARRRLGRQPLSPLALIRLPPAKD